LITAGWIITAIVLAIGVVVYRLTFMTSGNHVILRLTTPHSTHEKSGTTQLLLRTLRRRFQRRHQKRMSTDELAAVVEAIAGLLRTGLSLGVALDVATRDASGDLCRSLSEALTSARHLGLVTTLQEWADAQRADYPQVPMVARALVIVNHGGPTAATALDGLADGLRAMLAVDREVAALSSQARLSGVVMALVPLAFSALLSGTDANARAFLLGSPLGVGCLTIGLTLDALAWWWMRRLAVVRW
jgi:tight adherence protein B